MSSIVPYVIQAENKYGSIKKAPINCEEFKKVREALHFKIKKEETIDINKLIDYINNGYNVQETARSMSVSYNSVKKWTDRLKLSVHQPFRYVVDYCGHLYYSPKKYALTHKFKGIPIEPTFRRYRDLKENDYYFEDDEWKVFK